MSEDLLQKAREAARPLLLARAAFDVAYTTYFAYVKPSTDDEAWPLLIQLRQQIDEYRFGYARKENGVRDGIDEMFRLVAVGKAKWTYEELASFAQWYDAKSNALFKALRRLRLSEDSLGDLCDSLVLAGKPIVEEALSGQFKSPEEVIWRVAAVHGEAWAELVNGENYVEMLLSDACRKWFLVSLRGEHIPGCPEFTSEEQELLSHTHSSLDW